MASRTPPVITKQLKALARKLSPNKNPIYLTVYAEPSALIDECFANVETKIEIDGGHIVYGWQLWELPNILVEGEFHAVWCSPSDELREITPKKDGEQKILFLPDPIKQYRGIRIDNVRMPLRDDLLIHHFIKVNEDIVKIMNQGEWLDQNQVQVSQNVIKPLLEFRSLTGEMLNLGLRSHDSCICGSGIKYKKCHGKSPPF